MGGSVCPFICLQAETAVKVVEYIGIAAMTDLEKTIKERFDSGIGAVKRKPKYDADSLNRAVERARRYWLPCRIT